MYSHRSKAQKMKLSTSEVGHTEVKIIGACEAEHHGWQVIFTAKSGQT